MRMGGAHHFRLSVRVFDIHQFTLADSGAPASGFVPGATAVQELWPVRERAALRGLCLVNAAAAAYQKLALRMPRHAQTASVLCAKNIAALKLGRRHFQVIGKPNDVVFGQIHETLLFTTSGASGLARKPHCF
jgi:7-keto-8-aminopelargonate synthetase-like enzyme